MKKILVFTLFFMILFTTTTLAISNTTVPLDKTWTVTFTDEVQASSLKKGLIYIYDNKYNKIPTNFSLSKDGKSLFIKSETLLKPDSNYNIYINKNIRSESNIPLSKDFIYPFKTDDLNEDNIQSFTENASKNFVDIIYTDGVETSKKLGFLVCNSNKNQTLVYTYYPYDIAASSFYVSHNGTKLNGTILSYDEDSNILVLDISTSLSFDCLLEADYSIDNTFFTTLTVDDFKISLNKSGRFYGLSIGDSTETKLDDISLNSPLNIPFNKFRAIKDTLLPPKILDSSFNAIENSINLELDTDKNFIIYFSKNSDAYSPLRDSTGSIDILSGKKVKFDLNRFSKNDYEKEFDIYMKVYSSESGTLSTNFSFLLIKVSKISETDRVLSVVKNGKFNLADNESIEESFSSFFRTSHWEVKQGNEVHFSGNGFYKGSYSNIQFVFTVDLSNKNFRLEEVSKNNYPVNYNELPNLINTITEN